MIIPGLCSITFRKKTITEVALIASQCGLRSIEWGGDIHVPPGRTNLAREARQVCGDLGLIIKSYGSYFCVGRDAPDDFPVVLDTAREMGADNVRVWAGPTGSDRADSMLRNRIYSDVTRLSEMSASYCMSISYEFHCGTLTDTAASAVLLLESTDRPNIYTYWQPVCSWSIDENVAALMAIRSRLLHCHVFAWDAAGVRLPLSVGIKDWRRYLSIIEPLSGDHCFYLEFTQNDDVECFKKDAKTLNALISGNCAQSEGCRV